MNKSMFIGFILILLLIGSLSSVSSETISIKEDERLETDNGLIETFEIEPLDGIFSI